MSMRKFVVFLGEQFTSQTSIIEKPETNPRTNAGDPTNSVSPRYTSGNFQQRQRQRQEKCSLKINRLRTGLRLLRFFRLARAGTLQHCRCKELKDSLLKKERHTTVQSACRAGKTTAFSPSTSDNS